MSIVESLRKLVDPVQAKQDDEERRSAREQPVHEQAGDPPRFVCRVCGHEDIQKAYCPECLADTMEAVPAPGRARSR
jgi:rubrerythrin